MAKRPYSLQYTHKRKDLISYLITIDQSVLIVKYNLSMFKFDVMLRVYSNMHSGLTQDVEREKPLEMTLKNKTCATYM